MLYHLLDENGLIIIGVITNGMLEVRYLMLDTYNALSIV